MLCPLCGAEMVAAGERTLPAEDSNGAPVTYTVHRCVSGKDRCAERTEVLVPVSLRAVRA